MAYKSLTTTKNSLFLRTDHRNVVHENFSETSGYDKYVSKTCSNRSGLLIASTPERFGLVQAKILITFQNGLHPLPKKFQLYIGNFSTEP